MLTHYIVMFAGRTCAKIGEGTLHDLPLLAPSQGRRNDEFYELPIIRGTKRANERARKEAQKAIRRTLKVMALFRRNTIYGSAETTDDLKRLIQIEGASPFCFKVVGMRHGSFAKTQKNLCTTTPHQPEFPTSSNSGELSPTNAKK